MSIPVDDLRRVPLFEGMTDRALEALADLASEVAIPTGTVVTSEGQAGNAFYLLLSGTASVSRGGHDIRQLGAGDFFGEISLVDGRPVTATIVATTDVTAVEIRRDGFLELMERFSAVRLGILMALTERVRADQRELV